MGGGGWGGWGGWGTSFAKPDGHAMSIHSACSQLMEAEIGRKTG